LVLNVGSHAAGRIVAVAAVAIVFHPGLSSLLRVGETRRWGEGGGNDESGEEKTR
jgi:hypothetical protein